MKDKIVSRSQLPNLNIRSTAEGTRSSHKVLALYFGWFTQVTQSVGAIFLMVHAGHAKCWCYILDGSGESSFLLVLFSCLDAQDTSEKQQKESGLKMWCVNGNCSFPSVSATKQKYQSLRCKFPQQRENLWTQPALPPILNQAIPLCSRFQK